MTKETLKVKQIEKNWWDLLAAMILIAVILTSSTRLVATKWVPHLSLVQNVAVWGTIAGLAFGKSKFSRWIVLLYAFVYGIYVIPWQLGLTMGEGIIWRERIFSMIGRIQVIFGDLLTQRDVRDNLFFLLVMAVLYWVFGVYAGFQLVRNANIWRAVIPAGLAAFVIHLFDLLIESRSWYLPLYIFLCLILLARVHFLRQRRKWEAERTHVPTDVGFDLGRIALGISIVVIFIAWNTPILSSTLSGFADLYGNLNRPWLTLKDRMSFMFASLRASVGLVSDSFGNTESLGLGSPKSNAVVMSVEGPKYPFLGARYYWRARVYDEYYAGTWTTNQLEKTPFAPDKDYFKQERISGRFEAVFRITPYTAIGELFLPSQPTWVSRPGTLQYGSISGGLIDMVALQAVPYIRPGEQYEARSNLASFTQYRLRNAQGDYPQWVMDHYLQMPENISPRTRALAQQIAQGLENPYDIAEAVTQYLRENIEYQTTIDPPPQEQEVIDWFLFDYKKGFCNYYATAEVILLRSLGIPARWAVGYAEGERMLTEEELTRPQLEERLPETTSMDVATFNVRQKDAHAWPEVYFPGVGWVEFEPTVSQSPIFRPAGQSSNPSAIQNPAPEREEPLLEPTPNIPEGDRNKDLESGKSSGIPVGTLLFGVVLMLAGGLFFFVYMARDKRSRIGMWWERVSKEAADPFPVQIDRGLRRIGIEPPSLIRRWSFYVLLPALGRAYQEINWALRRLRKKPVESATPAERTAMLVQELPQADRLANKLLREYERGTYSTHPADLFSAKQSSTEIRRMSIATRLQRLFFGSSETRKKR
jgi:transglutaminase-like putative cysteine protease